MTAAAANDWLFEDPPKLRPAKIEPELAELKSWEPPRGPNWLTVILAAALVFVVARNYQPTPGPSPTPDPIIDVDGTAALVLVDASQSGQLSKGQAAAANWAGVLEFTEARGIAYRKFDVRDDIANDENVEEIFRVLAKNAAPPPSLTLVRDGRLQTGELPDSIDRFKATLDPN